MHQIRFPVLTVRETVQPARLPDVRDAALFEIARIAEDFHTPDDDVRPFLLLGNDEGVHSITPTFPRGRVAPVRRAALDVHRPDRPDGADPEGSHLCCVRRDRMDGSGWRPRLGPRASDRPDKQEAVTVMLADALGTEETLIAAVDRHRFKPATVGEFRVLEPPRPAVDRRGFPARLSRLRLAPPLACPGLPIGDATAARSLLSCQRSMSPTSRRSSVFSCEVRFAGRPLDLRASSTARRRARGFDPVEVTARCRERLGDHERPQQRHARRVARRRANHFPAR